MIKMPPSYVEELRRKRELEPTTKYRLTDPSVEPYYDIRGQYVPGEYKGFFKLYYALKSFPKLHDNQKFHVFFISNKGIFVEDQIHSAMDEPIKFANISLSPYHDFNDGDICINLPDTRELLFLFNVRFEEVIDGVVYPNMFYFFNHPEIMSCREHYLVIYSTNFEPVKIDFDKNLYDALHVGRPYLHLRQDNYIEWKNIKTWNPTF